MSLIKLWKANPDGFNHYKARQIVAFAGDGNLRDNSDCSKELREYLGSVNIDRLAEYALECLNHSFPDSGFFLQDVVNELGRRLEFDVNDGRYRGVQGAVGFDGIWNIPSGPSIVVEVKTTDTYNVSLDSIAGYRSKLLEDGTLDKSASVLFVVGRKDTGALEAQIRGSRHAWDMRVVGVDSLVRLVRVKEKSSEDQTVIQIRELLRPFEYTRVDRILDVVFNAANDVTQDEQPYDSEGQNDSDEATSITQDRTPQQKLDDVRLKVAEALNLKLGANLIRKRQALFEDKEGSVRACITVSKRYDNALQPYWYAFHPKWDAFLEGAQHGYMVFGCVDRNDAFAIPISEMRKILPSLNQTIKSDGSVYWHVKFADFSTGLVLFASKTGEKFSLQNYRVELQ